MSRSCWVISHRFDADVVPLADRHYNRQTPGASQFAPPGRCWYDTENVLDGDTEYIAPALRYLELRGLIERHPTRPWVRVRDEA